MSRVVVVADSGRSMAELTQAVGTVAGAYIVRYGSGRKPVDGLLAATAPDVVLMGGLRTVDQTLARLAEARRGCPDASVVLLSSYSTAGSPASALRAEAAAVMPDTVGPETLGLVLRDVLVERERRGPAITRRRERRPATRSTGRTRSVTQTSIKSRPEEEGRMTIQSTRLRSAGTRGRRPVDAGERRS